jgi:hypothetical protein
LMASLTPGPTKESTCLLLEIQPPVVNKPVIPYHARSVCGSATVLRRPL